MATMALDDSPPVKWQNLLDHGSNLFNKDHDVVLASHSDGSCDFALDALAVEIRQKAVVKRSRGGRPKKAATVTHPEPNIPKSFVTSPTNVTVKTRTLTKKGTEHNIQQNSESDSSIDCLGSRRANTPNASFLAVSSPPFSPVKKTFDSFRPQEVESLPESPPRSPFEVSLSRDAFVLAHIPFEKDLPSELEYDPFDRMDPPPVCHQVPPFSIAFPNKMYPTRLKETSPVPFVFSAPPSTFSSGYALQDFVDITGQTKLTLQMEVFHCVLCKKSFRSRKILAAHSKKHPSWSDWNQL